MAWFVAWVVVVTTFLPRLLNVTIDLAYSLVGVLAAAPVLLWAEYLRRNA